MINEEEEHLKSSSSSLIGWYSAGEFIFGRIVTRAE
jgi:hypothetical protein